MDRHSGEPYETQPVFTDAATTGSHELDDEGEGLVNETFAAVRFTTLNVDVSSEAPDFEHILQNCDILCLQEISESVLADLSNIGDRAGFKVVSPSYQGRAFGMEGFDVVLCFRVDMCRLLGVWITPCPEPSLRCLLFVKLRVLGNGAVLLTGTVHLDASHDSARVRRQSLELCMDSPQLN